MNCSYLRKYFQSALVTFQRVAGSSSRRRRRFRSPFFDRWIQSLTMSAPSSASICSKKAISDSIRS
jgi:hypothetical protein